MLVWQFWTLLGVGLGAVLLVLNQLAQITEATYRVAQLVVELTDQAKEVRFHAFQIEKHTETLEREALRD